MKKILFILLLLPFFAESQTYQSMPQAGYGPVKRMLFDSVLTIPLSITSLRNISGGRDVGQLRYNVADSSPYIYSGYQWIKIGGGTGSSQWTDVTGGINYSGGKVGIGTSTPVYKFDVNGTAGATDLEITNSVNVGNGVSTGGILHADGNLETQDSVKFTNLTSKVLDTTNYKPLVIGSTGNVHKTNWLSGGGSSSSWSLTGNTGITYDNFIGTLEAKPFKIVVNNDTVGKFDLNNNIGLGYQSVFNITTGQDNIGLGQNNLHSNTSGISNHSIGNSSLYANTTGSNNVALGNTSLQNNTTGSNNISIGLETVPTNTTGSDNIGIGYQALPSLDTGLYNIGIGYQALTSIIKGKWNTGVGYKTRIYNIDTDSTEFYNSTAIGAFAQVSQSNSMVLGSINGVNGATASTNVGIGTTTPTATLHLINTFRYQDGNEANGKVLTSDANGNATWQTAGAGSGWGLDGNAITPDKFLGTTNGENLLLKSAGNIIDSSGGRSIVTIGANINLISDVGITLTSGNKEITLNGVDTSTDATDSMLTVNNLNIVKKRALPTMPIYTNYWSKNADSNIYVIDTFAYVGIGTATPNSTLDVIGTISSSGVTPNVDSVGSVGISSKRWKELWLNGGDALYLGRVNITDSAFTEGKVLTGSSTGRAVWKTPTTGTGTVTSIATGLGLSGGTITTAGTLLVDTASASILSRQRAANTYTLISDTSLFSRKSVAAYSIRVNNTNSTANMTTDNFRTVGETSLAASDTVTWSGSTAPSGSTSNTYRWTQIGNRVWVDITLSNTTNGSAVTGVVVKLPTSLPTPAEPTGQTAANQYMYPVNAVFVSSSNALISAAARCGIRNNSVNNAYELVVNVSSIAPSTGIFSFTYTTN